MGMNWNLDDRLRGDHLGIENYPLDAKERAMMDYLLTKIEELQEEMYDSEPDYMNGEY